MMTNFLVRIWNQKNRRTKLFLFIAILFGSFIVKVARDIVQVEHALSLSIRSSYTYEMISAMELSSKQHQQQQKHRNNRNRTETASPLDTSLLVSSSVLERQKQTENISLTTNLMQQQKRERQQQMHMEPTTENLTSKRDHPHAGARFSNGSWGFIADVTRVRTWMIRRYYNESSITVERDNKNQRKPLPLSYLPIEPGKEMDYICNVPPKSGNEKKAGWRLLSKKVQVIGSLSDRTGTIISNNDKHSESIIDETTKNGGCFSRITPYQNSFVNDPLPNNKDTVASNGRRSKLLCAIYTYEKNHDRVRAIAETWGWRCDGFFAASTKTIDTPPTTDTMFNGVADNYNSSNGRTSHGDNDVGYGAIDLPHEGVEAYSNMWQKTRSVWAYIHDNYLNEFDFFYLSGDDTHVIVENLRNLLDSCFYSDLAMAAPLYLGHWIPDSDAGYFIGGGPGYVLNRKSLQRFVQDVLPTCSVNDRNAAEDRYIGRCFRSIGIIGNHSVDRLGSQTFHGMDTHFVSSFDPTKTKNRPFFRETYDLWASQYGHKVGMDLVSSQSIAFHLLRKPQWMKRHHAILYNSCPKGTVIGDILSQEINNTIKSPSIAAEG